MPSGDAYLPQDLAHALVSGVGATVLVGFVPVDVFGPVPWLTLSVRQYEHRVASRGLPFGVLPDPADLLVDVNEVINHLDQVQRRFAADVHPDLACQLDGVSA